MRPLGRACPSDRLQTSHFFKAVDDSSRAYLVADSLFFGAFSRTPVAARPPIETKDVDVQQALRGRNSNPLFRVSPDSRLSADTFQALIKNGRNPFIATEAFFGHPIYPTFLTVLTSPENGIGSVLVFRRVSVIEPPYDTVLIDVSLFAPGPWTLGVLRPLPLDAGGGTSNFSYGG